MSLIDGLHTVASTRGPAETLDALEHALHARGITLFAKIDHAAGAAAVGLPLGATTVVIFGDPRGGTRLMEVAQTIGIDLPLKALVWQDGDGKTWLSYNDPAWLAKRHGVSAPAVAAMTTLLADLAREAT